jgi:hypothetical protein
MVATMARGSGVVLGRVGRAGLADCFAGSFSRVVRVSIARRWLAAELRRERAAGLGRVLRRCGGVGADRVYRAAGGQVFGFTVGVARESWAAELVDLGSRESWAAVRCLRPMARAAAGRSPRV